CRPVAKQGGNLGHFSVLAAQLLGAAPIGGRRLWPPQYGQDKRPLVVKLGVERVSDDCAVKLLRSEVGLSLPPIDVSPLLKRERVVGGQRQGPIQRGLGRGHIALGPRAYPDSDVAGWVVRVAHDVCAVELGRRGELRVQVANFGEGNQRAVA